jgi:selenide,water dikinase
VINKLPIYKGLIKIENKVQNFRFMEGYAAETSGGLLICISQEKKKELIAELNANEINNWEIGFVRDGNKTAVLEKAEVLEV